MVVILFHQDQELKLLNLQKQLISSLNKNGTIFYEYSPLWLPLQLPLPVFQNNNNNPDLKDISKNIKKITLNGFSFEKNTIFIEGTCKILQFRNKNNLINNKIVSDRALEDFYNIEDDYNLENVYTMDNVYNDDYKIKLPFLKIFKIQDDFYNKKVEFLKKLEEKTDLFPLNLKIFRLGTPVNISTNSQEISNSIWVKLK